MENDPLTNAGFGSNLTLEGNIECDASVMNGENLIFGACGAVRRVKNPICLAHDIYKRQLLPLPLGKFILKNVPIVLFHHCGTI